MSWSATGVAYASDVHKAISELECVYPLEPEAQEQLALGKELLKQVLDSGALGSYDGYAFSASGHANPGHTQREGWAHDSVAISISGMLSHHVAQQIEWTKKGREAAA